ncbi:PTS galactitol transporter subunit IIC [Bacillaceae bacterium Marseille-Q3522]|nr:PTS galactitol transporter subunit IIC [Bacillaceae bacterium Marseille-Q3522]
MDIIQWFVDLGPSVMLPIILFVFGLVLKAKPGKAFKAGLTVGIGFIGLNLVIGLLGESLGTAAQAMTERFGFNLTTIDVGWPAAAAISYGTVIGSMAIPIGIAINFILVLVGLTKTLDVDVWDYWHVAFTGSLMFIITGNVPLSIFTFVAHLLIVFWLSDLMAPDIEKFYGFKNITFPHGGSAPSYLVAKPLNYLFDRIPGLKNLNADAESIQKKFGIFGDSTIMGLIIGIVMGTLAGYDLNGILNLGVKTAAVMLLMPRMVSILMEGLNPISEAASDFVKRKMPDRDIYIGMDSALSVGHPGVLTASLVLIPITIFLAVILPGNTVLPFGDLATIPFLICLMAPAFKGNVIRLILGGSIYIGVGLYIATWTAPLVTKAAAAANFDLQNYASISSLVDGAVWTTGIFVWVGGNIPWIGITVLALIGLGGLIYNNKLKPRRSFKEQKKAV